MLGRLEGNAIRPAPIAVSAMCHRVPVLDGHTEAVSVRLRGAPGPAAVREAFAAFRGEPQKLGLPSAPASPILLHDLDERPQVRIDVEVEQGMPVHVGRIRECRVLGIKFALLGHNAERGAAGASMLNAELAHARGLM
jgi:aspartate-semialdehyde dehydrogenase